MKTWKNNVFIGILAFFFTLSVFSCSENKNKLSGTWEITEKNSSYEVDPDNKYIVTINFSGKDFTIISYPMYYSGAYAAYYTNYHSFHPDITSDSSMKHFINWDKDIIEIFKEGRDEITIFRNELKGKYSISDNKIELLFSDGKINVCSFSRTENTMTINGRQFTRSKKVENNKTSKVNINSDSKSSEKKPEIIGNNVSEKGVKTIKITGLDLKYSVFYNVISLSSNSTDGDGPYTFGNNVNYNDNEKFRTFTGDLYFEGEIWTGSGSYFIHLILVDNEEYGNEHYISKKKISFNKNITEIKFSDFNFIERTQGQ